MSWAWPPAAGQKGPAQIDLHLITQLGVCVQICSVWTAAHLPLQGPGLVPAVLCGGGRQGQLLRKGPAGADALRPVALHPRQDHLAHRRLHHAGQSLSLPRLTF